MNQALNKTEISIQWIYWLAWITLLAFATVPFAWGQEYRYDRDRDDGRNDRFSQSDVEAMRKLIDFETAAVELAKAGDDKTRHGELSQYLDTVEDSGEQRLDRLQGWLERRHGEAWEPRLGSTYERRIGDLRSKDVKGDEFEIRMLKYTIEQHQDEVATLQSYLPRIESDELARMCQEVIDRRLADTRRLQSWLKQWYDISYDSPHGGRIRQGTGTRHGYDNDRYGRGSDEHDHEHRH